MDILKYVMGITIVILIGLLVFLCYMLVPASDPVKMEVTYYDNSKEIIITEKYFKGGPQVLSNGCLINIYDNQRCSVKMVKILPQ